MGRSMVRDLEQAGFEVTLVRSYVRALDVRATFEMAVFDVDLDDGSGVELAARMRDAGKVRCPVFFTGTTSDTILDRATAIGPVVLKQAGVTALVARLLAELEARTVTKSGFVPRSHTVSRDSDTG